jgi:sialate O-acetylesterase
MTPNPVRWLLAGWLALLPLASTAELRLATVFGDHMVLQRDAPVRVWGQGTPGQALQVVFRGQRLATRVSAAGRWQATLAAAPAGGPHELTVKGETTLRIGDILVGDVWLCAGQSNMEWPLAQASDGEREVAAATDAQIRHLRVPRRASTAPQDDIAPAPWTVASPATAGDFSAVGWFFARRMRAAQGVPVGLINVSWGGTHIETWTRPGAAAADPDLARWVANLPADVQAFQRQLADRARDNSLAWQHGLPLAGPGFTGWAAIDVDETAWPTLQVPQIWEEQGLAGFDGIVWYRRHVKLSAGQAADANTLRLGMIDDCDETWVNGTRVGGLCQWDAPRSYMLPAGLLREGDNVIAVRVTDTGGGGGFHGAPDAVALENPASRILLAGPWHARVEAPLKRDQVEANDAPTLGYNGMVHPLLGLRLAGALWYQGEANVARAARYAGAFQRLITDWRLQWDQPAMPFLFVQLAAFLPVANNSMQSSPWAELRDAQSQALALPRTGMAVTTDVGEEHDIHPRNKQAVGDRLAALALGETPATPRFKALLIKGAQAELTFTGGGLRARNESEALRGFAVAGSDRRFVQALARVEGRRIVVWHPEVKQPVAVRFGWVDNPQQDNVVDALGRPLSPFRTDIWPLSTEGVAFAP